ncbi:MAG: LuxR family transcriptional regulator [Methylococcales bacterium]
MELSLAIDLLSNVRNFSDIKKIIKETLAVYDMEYFIYVAKFPISFLRPEIIILNGYPQEWHDRYISMNYADIDPVLKKSDTEILPIIWSELIKEVKNKESLDFMNEATEFDLQNGVTIPFRGSCGETALLSLATSSRNIKSMASLVEASRMFLFLIPYIHNSVREVSLIEKGVFKGYALSDRELECLMWGAEGKTTWEIGEIIGVKKRTVIFHFHNICEKLNTVSRQQAIAKAISLNIIKSKLSNGFKEHKS